MWAEDRLYNKSVLSYINFQLSINKIYLANKFLVILVPLVPRHSDPIVSLALLLSLDLQVSLALILQHLVAAANHHSWSKHKIVTGRRFCFYLGQKLRSLTAPFLPMVPPWSPWPPWPPGSLAPLVPLALILQYCICSGGQPSLRKQARNCHWKKVLLLSGPKIWKPYSPLFMNGSP